MRKPTCQHCSPQLFGGKAGCKHNNNPHLFCIKHYFSPSFKTLITFFIIKAMDSTKLILSKMQNIVNAVVPLLLCFCTHQRALLDCTPIPEAASTVHFICCIYSSKKHVAPLALLGKRTVVSGSSFKHNGGVRFYGD